MYLKKLKLQHVVLAMANIDLFTYILILFHISFPIPVSSIYYAVMEF